MTRNGTGLPYRRPRANTFSAWIWKSVLFETGPTGNMPLGLSNPSRVPCPPATSSTATSPRAERLVPAADGVRVDRCRGLRRDRGEAVGGRNGDRLVPGRVQPVELVQVDARELIHQRCPLVQRPADPSRAGRAPAGAAAGGAANRCGQHVTALQPDSSETAALASQLS